MKTQNYKNHIRYYLPHHVFFYAAIAVLLALSINGIVRHPHRTIWIIMTALVFVVGWLSFMLRQHYALTCQNRIVRLEMRFRYFILTGKKTDVMEQQLTFNQLAALRFASDDELLSLTDRAIKEQLSPNAIKALVVNWQPDHMRV